MAILFGTTPDGETLPVQVNESGQLVAQGLEGPPGPEGPEGPEGPPGPAGEVGSVIKSIQHVEVLLKRNESFKSVSISPVDPAKAFISDNGQVIYDPDLDYSTYWNGYYLAFNGGARVEVLRSWARFQSTIKFSVVEYV